MAATSTHETHCRKATELIEVRELRALHMRERIGLWMHMRICAACRAYRKQSRMIDRWLEKRTGAGEAIESLDLEARIINGVARRP
ncbi:MAG: hypothetical protein KA175_04615 [Flavobacteriales bacterium]|nr:hypothetical protein [Flavobacteriales bacterium]MBP6696877.1 hypothetical protein [Flavobacteriales bacterium]